MEPVIIKDGQRVLAKNEVAVVQALSEGLRASAIGQAMGISNRTVEAIVSRLMKDFECRSSSHLVATFLRKKIIK